MNERDRQFNCAKTNPLYDEIDRLKALNAQLLEACKLAYKLLRERDAEIGYNGETSITAGINAAIAAAEGMKP